MKSQKATSRAAAVQDINISLWRALLSINSLVSDDRGGNFVFYIKHFHLQRQKKNNCREGIPSGKRHRKEHFKINRQYHCWYLQPALTRLLTKFSRQKRSPCQHCTICCKCQVTVFVQRQNMKCPFWDSPRCDLAWTRSSWFNECIVLLSAHLKTDSGRAWKERIGHMGSLKWAGTYVYSKPLGIYVQNNVMTRETRRGRTFFAFDPYNSGHVYRSKIGTNLLARHDCKLSKINNKIKNFSLSDLQGNEFTASGQVVSHRLWEVVDEQKGVLGTAAFCAACSWSDLVTLVAIHKLPRSPEGANIPLRRLWSTLFLSFMQDSQFVSENDACCMTNSAHKTSRRCLKRSKIKCKYKSKIL